MVELEFFKAKRMAAAFLCDCRKQRILNGSSHIKKDGR